MKIGAVYPQTELRGDPEAVRRIGLAVESLGYDHLLAYDHVVGAVHADREPKLWGPYTEHDPFHDPFVMFAYLAGITERIEFATGAPILPQRQTVLVAKQAADLELLSGGRLRLGVGVGWNYVEYDAVGQDFHTRGRRADEQIGYLRQLWNNEVSSFDGEFDTLERASSTLGRIARSRSGWAASVPLCSAAAPSSATGSCSPATRNGCTVPSPTFAGCSPKQDATLTGSASTSSR